MQKKRLIVVEGFDRAGKDSLLDDLEKISSLMPKTVVMRNNLEGMPKYDKEQDDFLSWLDKFIDAQIEEIEKLAMQNDTIIMARFLISDEVYSTLFNRKHTVKPKLSKLPVGMEVHNYIILFESYKEYIDRIKMVEGNEYVAQYSEDEFNELNHLYCSNINAECNADKLVFLKASTTRLSLLVDFITRTYIGD